jgi:hypothetical protein
MARVLRNSKGQFAGSTGGWGRGNRNAAGPNTGRSNSAARRGRKMQSQARTRAQIQRGASIGVAIGGTVATHVLARRAVRSSNPKLLAAAAAAAVVIANAGGINAKRLKSRTVR